MNNYTQKAEQYNFRNLFDNKGAVGAVAEKALQNYKSKHNEKANVQERLHYFTVGHSFKQTFKKIAFDMRIPDKGGEEIPHRFTSLLLENFKFTEQSQDQLYRLIDSIRNVNSHYLHSLDVLNCKNIPGTIIQFIKEAFEFASVHVLYHLHKTTLADNPETKTILLEQEKEDILAKLLQDDKALIRFWQEVFYQTLYTGIKKQGKNSPVKDDQKMREKEEEKAWLDKNLKTKQDWIQWILFKDVAEDLKWNLKDDHETHEILRIDKGRYLSFEGMLFLLSMFLYKSEANSLVPKIKGFKKSQTKEDQSKRDLFSYFSKKFSSQDIDSEETGLVKFRDIMLYLNKYPLSWNKLINTESGLEEVQVLLQGIREREIKNRFPGMEDFEDFSTYAKALLFDNVKHRHFPKSSLYYDIILNNDEFRKTFLALKANKLNIKEYKEDSEKGYCLNYALKHYYPENAQYSRFKNYNYSDYKKEKYEKELFQNKATLKFIKIIDSKLFNTSYGRNNDRFLDYALGYLAGSGFFGLETGFKMYQFYSPQEQAIEFEAIRKELNKKEVGKLKYHDGRLIHFSTYQDKHAKYPEWDYPFVIQNNAAYLQINNLEGTICLQRGAIIYLLELALYHGITDGAAMLRDYFSKKIKEAGEARQALTAIPPSVSAADRAHYKRLLPKTLVGRYAGKLGHPKGHQPPTVYEKLLADADAAEKRFNMLLAKAETAEDRQRFLEKNKGKQFRLRFLRKAWHFMYFETAYKINLERAKGHHSGFHIMREEFNDFCKWMYAFDEVPEYKERLMSLFSSKGFFSTNTEFEKDLKAGKDLSGLYDLYKAKFEKWIQNRQRETDKPTKPGHVDSYACYLKTSELYINIYHFRDFIAAYLKERGQEVSAEKFTYQSLANKQWLVADYYMQYDRKRKQEPDYYRAFNDQKQNLVEDCLLYEIAQKYLSREQAVTIQEMHIARIINATVTYRVVAKKKIPGPKNNSFKNIDTPYTVETPFRDMQKILQLIYLNEKQKEKDYNYSVLYRLPQFLEQSGKEKTIKNIAEKFNNTKKISIADVNTVNGAIISNAAKLTSIVMILEAYFIYKYRLTLDHAATATNNRLQIGEISGLPGYFPAAVNLRGQAFHFNLPLFAASSLPNKAIAEDLQEESFPYQEFLAGMEIKFITEEVNGNLNTFDNIPAILKRTLSAFLKTLHSDYFPPADRGKEDKMHEAAQASYIQFINKTK